MEKLNIASAIHNDKNTHTNYKYNGEMTTENKGYGS